MQDGEPSSGKSSPPLPPNTSAQLVTLSAAEGAGTAGGQRGGRGEGAGPAMAPPPGQTRLPDWDGLKLRVRTLIATHRVMIFSKSYCPYCNKVRRRRCEPAGRRSPRAPPLEGGVGRAVAGGAARAGPGRAQGAGLREGGAGMRRALPAF